MGDEIYKENQLYELEYLQVNAGTNIIPTATVRLKSEIGNDFRNLPLVMDL